MKFIVYLFRETFILIQKWLDLIYLCCSLLTRRCSATQSQVLLQSPLQAATTTGHSAMAMVSSNNPCRQLERAHSAHVSCTLVMPQVRFLALSFPSTQSCLLSEYPLFPSACLWRSHTPDELLDPRTMTGMQLSGGHNSHKTDDQVKKCTFALLGGQ